VVLLGVTWTLARRVGAGAASVEDGVLLAVAAAGMAAAALIAARIVFVVGRLHCTAGPVGEGTTPIPSSGARKTWELKPGCIP